MFGFFKNGGFAIEEYEKEYDVLYAKVVPKDEWEIEWQAFSKKLEKSIKYKKTNGVDSSALKLLLAKTYFNIAALYDYLGPHEHFLFQASRCLLNENLPEFDSIKQSVYGVLGCNPNLLCAEQIIVIKSFCDDDGQDPRLYVEKRDSILESLGIAWRYGDLNSAYLMVETELAFSNKFPEVYDEKHWEQRALWMKKIYNDCSVAIETRCWSKLTRAAVLLSSAKAFPGKACPAFNKAKKLCSQLSGMFINSNTKYDNKTMLEMLKRAESLSISYEFENEFNQSLPSLGNGQRMLFKIICLFREKKFLELKKISDEFLKRNKFKDRVPSYWVRYFGAVARYQIYYKSCVEGKERWVVDAFKAKALHSFENFLDIYSNQNVYLLNGSVDLCKNAFAYIYDISNVDCSAEMPLRVSTPYPVCGEEQELAERGLSAWHIRFDDKLQCVLADITEEQAWCPGLDADDINIYAELARQTKKKELAGSLREVGLVFR